MNTQAPHMMSDRQPIRQLDDAAANRIAAGEVVERPASAIKELVENALDAGAVRIEISYSDGGKTLIRVLDDGTGIPADELPLALSRHATSKIDGSDLLNIHSFGFRGEALPSLGAVGRLTITSRFDGSETAARISVNGGEISPVQPAALARGTVVELRDLFHATPARLKFLRSDRAESSAINDVVKRLAMAAPDVGFVLRDVTKTGAGRVVFRADPETGDFASSLRARLRGILGADFTDNAIEINAERGGILLSGFAALPTYSRGAAVSQFFFVNGRPVRDKQFYGALRAAYSDVLTRGRHPAAALFLSCDPEQVDVNVHPAKAEVRFRDPALPRGLIVSGLRHALAGSGHRASGTVGQETLNAMRPQAPVYQYQRSTQNHQYVPPPVTTGGFAEADTWQSGRVEPTPELEQNDPTDLPLGAARAQLHENYIIAQTQTGMIIVDQHAAHERLVYERLKSQMQNHGVAAQVLLIPEIVELSADDHSRLMEHVEALASLGLSIDSFGEQAICVRETPVILGEINCKNLISDICDQLSDDGSSGIVKEKINAILSSMACHGSIRSGRRMSAPEMNALLREMEATPHSGQCNHGRPTYVELPLSDIERLFGRS
ncbi:MAG: DNA mismatch repair endonuclease MutL [Rhodobacteraceae bacterium]|nr:DNA mismatch repair endonuclease MutL [Paracoccaceae bacterium]